MIPALALRPERGGPTSGISEQKGGRDARRAAGLAGDWALPTGAAMEADIRREARRQARQFTARERHTMEVDYYVYECDLRKRVLPAGQARARAGAGAGARAGAGAGTSVR